jgi:hypothetical protein
MGKVLRCKQCCCYCCSYYYTCVGAAVLYMITMHVTAVPTAILRHIAAVQTVVYCTMHALAAVIAPLLLQHRCFHCYCVLQQHLDNEILPQYYANQIQYTTVQCTQQYIPAHTSTLYQAHTHISHTQIHCDTPAFGICDLRALNSSACSKAG